MSSGFLIPSLVCFCCKTISLFDFFLLPLMVSVFHFHCFLLSIIFFFLNLISVLPFSNGTCYMYLCFHVFGHFIRLFIPTEYIVIEWRRIDTSQYNSAECYFIYLKFRTECIYYCRTFYCCRSWCYSSWHIFRLFCCVSPSHCDFCCCCFSDGLFPNVWITNSKPPKKINWHKITHACTNIFR